MFNYSLLVIDVVSWIIFLPPARVMFQRRLSVILFTVGGGGQRALPPGESTSGEGGYM